MRLFVAELLRYSVSALVHNLVAKEAIGKEEFGLSSPCVVGTTADCTEQLKYLFGVCSTKRCIFEQTSCSGIKDGRKKAEE